MSFQSCEVLNALLSENVELAETLIRSGKSINTQNEFGVCALHFAVEKGSLDLVRLLLEQGASPNIRNEHHEISPVPFSQAQEIVLEELQNLARATALHIAAKNGFLEIATLLIRYGAIVDIKDSGGCTPLHWAAIQGDLTFIKLLVESGANVNLRDMANSTPLHEAVRHRHSKIVKYLLERGANPEIRDITGTSPLELAAPLPILYNLLLQYSSILPPNVTKH